MSEATSELSVLVPDSELYTLVSGLQVRVVDLKTRQFFRLMRILTHGAGTAISNGVLDLDPEATTEEFLAKLLMVVVMAIPDAEDESISFLCSMVEPADLKKDRKLSKDDKLANDLAWTRVSDELGDNPELEDLIGLIEVIVKREAADIQALGKKLTSMLTSAQKTGQLPTTSTESVKSDDDKSQESN